MPFKSDSQRRWMYANEPEMAERWQNETPKGKDLPERVERKKESVDAEGLLALTKLAAAAKVAEPISNRDLGGLIGGAGGAGVGGAGGWSLANMLAGMHGRSRMRDLATMGRGVGLGEAIENKTLPRGFQFSDKSLGATADKGWLRGLLSDKARETITGARRQWTGGAKPFLRRFGRNAGLLGLIGGAALGSMGGGGLGQLIGMAVPEKQSDDQGAPPNTSLASQIGSLAPTALMAAPLLGGAIGGTKGYFGAPEGYGIEGATRGALKGAGGWGGAAAGGLGGAGLGAMLGGTATQGMDPTVRLLATLAGAGIGGVGGGALGHRVGRGIAKGRIGAPVWAYDEEKEE